MPDVQDFNFQEAFSRNVGWVSQRELAVLRAKRVAIAGVGGVGGIHLITLARLGIGAFNIADMDIFEQANFNRQAGAMMSTVGQTKVDVMARMARDINPELDLRIFPKGVNEGNVDAFLDGVDLYVDGLDAFELNVRRAVFAACARLGIPATTVGPLGMGAALVNFLPGKMSFEDYMGLGTARSELEQRVRFLVGVAPRAAHGAYLVDPKRIDLARKVGPSTPMGCQLCAGVAASEALKILLGRGKVYSAPHAIAYDAFLNKRTHTWRPGGYRNPLSRLTIAIGLRRMTALAAQTGAAAPPAPPPTDAVERVLTLARWAPSGDNMQPWRFERLSASAFVVHFRAPLADDVFDFGGHPSLLHRGIFLESLALAASQVGLRIQWHFDESSNARQKVGTERLHVELQPAPDALPDPLAEFLPLRSVDRRMFKRTALTPAQKLALQAAVGDEFDIHWFEGSERMRFVRLNDAADAIRFTIPETVPGHRRMVDWDRALSPDKIPFRATGGNKIDQALLRFAFASERRAVLLGQIPGAMMGARLSLAILPSYFCAAHFMLVRRQPAAGADGPASVMRAGRSAQRFWLAATRLGLVLQPGFALLAFSYYGRTHHPFTVRKKALHQARVLAEKFAQTCAGVGAAPGDVMFCGRIGQPAYPDNLARSARLPLQDLMVASASELPTGWEG